MTTMNKVERIEFVISEFRKADITIDENQADKFVRLCDFMVCLLYTSDAADE